MSTKTPHPEMLGALRGVLRELNAGFPNVLWLVDGEDETTLIRARAEHAPAIRAFLGGTADELAIPVTTFARRGGEAE